MPTIQKPALRALTEKLIAAQTAGTPAKVDTKVLDEIIAIIGDRKTAGITTTSSDSIAKQLRNGNMSPADKLALAKKGLDANEKKDLETLIAMPELKGMLDPVSMNFLKALVGLEPLRAIDTIETVRTTSISQGATNVQLAAVQKFRDILKTPGKIEQFYDAAIGAKDDPALKAEALKLFADLPKVNPSATADDMVALGLWTTKPRGIEQMEKSARYLPGRQVLCKTTVDDNAAASSFLAFKAGGREAITSRATLMGEKDGKYLVKIDGKEEPISVDKEMIHRLNQPHHLNSQDSAGDRFRFLSDRIADYSDPFVKAKIAECAILMDQHIQKLDFTKTATEAAGGQLTVFGRGEAARQMVDVQKACVKVTYDAIHMRYSHGGSDDVLTQGRAPNGETNIGRQAIRGNGMCVQQASVMGALLFPFAKMIGVDMQYVHGPVYRNWSPGKDAFDPYTDGHGWWQLSYRPSMEVVICDRTWNEVDKAMDRAYSRVGDRYPSGHMTGFVPEKLTPTDANMSGDVTVATFDRQFGIVGQDGRVNHMSLTQDP